MQEINLPESWLYRALLAVSTTGGQLCVLFAIFCVLTWASWARIPETDLMKQSFAAIMAFVTGAAGGAAVGYHRGKTEAMERSEDSVDPKP